MGASALIRVISMVLLGHVTITWLHFSSDVYPYDISQPSSFSHVVYVTAGHRNIDYFSPSLGSATTDVNIFTTPGNSLPNPNAYLRNQGGFNVKSDGWLTVDSHRRRITLADFQSFGNRWSVEQVSFLSRGTIWRLTASYDLKYRSLRPIMLRMLSSFKLRSAAKKG
jgi:hypothetical protein